MKSRTKFILKILAVITAIAFAVIVLTLSLLPCFKDTSVSAAYALEDDDDSYISSVSFRSSPFLGWDSGTMIYRVSDSFSSNNDPLFRIVVSNFIRETTVTLVFVPDSSEHDNPLIYSLVYYLCKSSGSPFAHMHVDPDIGIYFTFNSELLSSIAVTCYTSNLTVDFNGYFVWYTGEFVNGYAQRVVRSFINGSGYEDGFSEGYSRGYTEGFELGTYHGMDLGYEEGYTEGESAGYNKGLSENISSPVTLFLEPVHVFLNTNLFGTFSLGAAFSVVLFVAVAVIFIKMFAGG